MTPSGYRRNRIGEFLDQGLFRELGVPALAVSLVLFVSAMTLLGANLSELRASNGRVQQTNEVILQLAMVNTDILRIEMTVRGYALSGDPDYFTWLKMAEEADRARLDALEKEASGDADERSDVTTLKRLLAAQSAYFNQLIQRLATDRAGVIAEIVDYSKKVKRRPIENLLANMRDDQMRRLREQQQVAEDRVVDAYRYAIAISSLALVFGAAGFALILSARRRQRIG